MENMRKYAEKYKKARSEKSKRKYRAYMENVVGYAIVSGDAGVGALREVRDAALAD